MKNFLNLKKISLSNLETKRSINDKNKKKLKEKEKINYKEKKIDKQGHIMEKRINYEKKNIKIEKTLTGNNILRNNKLNNTNRQINNSEFFKKDRYKKENNILDKTSNNANNETNSVIKKIITNQFINKNYKTNEKLNSNNNNNNYILKQRPKIIQNNIYGTNNIYNNKYMNKTIEIEPKETNKGKDSINSENNIKINNNIVCLINPKCDNIIENFGLENYSGKRPIRKTNSSSKIYSSPNKELRILNYGDFNNNLNDNNTKGIYSSKNNWENKNNRTLNLMKENTNFIYKKSVRNNSCFKREKCLKNFGFNLKNEKKDIVLGFNSPRLSNYQKNERNNKTYLDLYNLKNINQEENENFNLPINEDFNRNRNIKEEKYYIYQSSINHKQNQRNKINRTFINKENNINSVDFNIIKKKNNNKSNKIYNNLRSKRIIKNSLKERRTNDSFVYNENIINKNINEVAKNYQTLVIEKTNEFNNFKEYKNQCNIYLNNNSIDEPNEKFNKTSIVLYENRKKIINSMKNRPKNPKDSRIKNREKFVSGDFKTLENVFNEKNVEGNLNIKKKDITLDSSPVSSHKNISIYTKKMNNKSKTNWKIYYKKNINDKKSDICSFKKVKTFKNEKSINSSTNNEDISIIENKNKDEDLINNKSYEEYSGLDDSFFENMNEKVNNQNCFQKKLYNYFIKKPNKKDILHR